MTNLEKYDDAFKDTFAIDDSQLAELEYQSIPEWDSVGHMGLVAGLEETFDIMLEIDDIVELSGYVKGKEILAKYDITGI
jgi:acyl carrier protein